MPSSLVKYARSLKLEHDLEKLRRSSPCWIILFVFDLLFSVFFSDNGKDFVAEETVVLSSLEKGRLCTFSSRW